jgi:hypothetical protein
VTCFRRRCAGSRTHVPAILLTACLVLSACTASHRALPRERATETATARGLAAGLLEHLDNLEVTSVSGSGNDLSISVMVEMSGPAVSFIHLYVQPPDFALTKCDADDGYDPVMCETDPDLTEVMRRKGPNEQMPLYEGRYFSGERGSILVQTWGRESPDTVELILEVLKDPGSAFEPRHASMTRARRYPTSSRCRYRPSWTADPRTTAATAPLPGLNSACAATWKFSSDAP